MCITLSHRTPGQKGITFANILIISVTLIVVAVPEGARFSFSICICCATPIETGLPLAVTLALAFATKRMTQEKLLVRVLGSCETMANASVICTDKTGTLTQNAMTVVAGSIGLHCKFVRQLIENSTRSNADEKAPERERKHPDDFSIDMTQLKSVLSPGIQTILNDAIAINSTAFEDVDPEGTGSRFVGNKTETALLSFAKEFEWPSLRHTREAAVVEQVIPFSSERKSMGVVVKRRDGKGFRAHFKGASEILSKRCKRHVVVEKPGRFSEERQAVLTYEANREVDEEVETREIDDLAEQNISRTIIFYANQTLRTIALCYRDFDSWPPPGMNLDEEDEVSNVALFIIPSLIQILFRFLMTTFCRT